MKVVVMSKTPYEVKTHTGVTNIAFTNGNYVLTVGVTTHTYSSANYMIMVI